MPKENGPFFAALFCACSANAGTVCADCYKCVSGTADNCYKCEYDENYCIGIEFPEVCAGNAQWDSTQKKCVCGSGSIMMACDTPWEFFDWSANVCDCVPVTCISGKYPVSANTCSDCPSPNFTLSSCSVQSSIDYATDTEMVIGGYNGCYIPGGCTGKDDTGTFELIADCKYSTALEVEFN